MFYRRLADWTEIGQKFILIAQESVAICQYKKKGGKKSPTSLCSRFCGFVNIPALYCLYSELITVTVISKD